MPDVLLEEMSPYGTRRASLLRGHGDVYLYLEDMTGIHPHTTSAVWVSNHRPAPADGDLGPDDGSPPRMAASGTAYPEGSPPLDPRARLVWFEEGDAVALVDRTGPLAAIPGWAGRDGFYGYSRHARGRNPLAWEMSPETREALQAEVDDSIGYWAWRDRGGDQEVRKAGLTHLETRIGLREDTWSIGSGGLLGLVASRHRLGDRDLWITATTGLSAQRMAGVEQFVAEGGAWARVELAVAHPTADRTGVDLLSELAVIPFERCTWFGEGHTIGGGPGVHGFGSDRFAVLLTADPPRHPDHPTPDLSGLSVRSDPVTYLWVMVIDEPTFLLARDRDARAALSHLTANGGTWVQA